MIRPLIFAIFFLSGAAALVYQIAWTRSLGLVFGASHLAVTTVLAVYMGGQALGAVLLGKRADSTDRPLRLYGFLELGIGIFAVGSIGLMKLYPFLYGPLARVAEENGAYLTALRITFAVVAMIVPTTLMGGTLPMLTRFVAGREGGLTRQLSYLYSLNTFGAVAGSLAAGFVLLKAFGVTVTLLMAAALSIGVGLASLALQRHAGNLGRAPTPEASKSARAPTHDGAAVSGLSVRLVLLGIGISGFCALGYEVLWTRMLTLVVGTSVYSFTMMLVAFLAGIGLGSHTFGLLRRRTGASGRATVLIFSGTQVAIGGAALAVTVLMRDLPAAAHRLQTLLVGVHLGEFNGRLIASFGVAVAFMFVPAFFMGAAFPAAGAVWSAGRGQVGGAVGRLLTTNTIGAILGSVVSGFVLVHLFGIERSLQMLAILNLATGLVVAASTGGWRWLIVTIPVAAALLLVARGAFPDWGRVWDQKYFATYTNNSRSLETPEELAEKLGSVEVLYYDEGVNETVSVTRPKGDIQTFIVNGRPEASNHPVDMQCQRTLGHLPMLLHPNPRNVFVLGTGTGMTLGATSLHPEVEELVLGEIEESVLGVARTFGPWNSHVLDNPKLKVVLNDGRNYLATTRKKFDVITADPIHPWSGGAAYLYTSEYFRSVADRLAPGGIACQWLPIYELTTRDLQTVVRTFSGQFRYVMVWRTYYDAELIGSNDPIAIDEAALARRLAHPAIHEDLAPVHMASATDFLSYFAMGDSGARAFGLGGDLNTDDNLVLEFSAPESQGIRGLDADNLLALSAARESLLPYLVPAASEPERQAQFERSARSLEIGRHFDPAHALYLKGKRRSPELAAQLARLEAWAPGYAPLRFLLDDKAFLDRTVPALVAEADVRVLTASGAEAAIRISAVRQFMGRGRVLVSFVNNPRREIYGQRYVYGEYPQLESQVGRYVGETLAALRAAAERVPPASGGRAPAEAEVAAALHQEAGRLVGLLPRPGHP